MALVGERRQALLRVALMVPERVVPTWVRILLDGLARDPGVDLREVVVAGGGVDRPVPARAARSSPALAVVLGLERRVFGRRLGGLEPVDVLEQAALVEVAGSSGRGPRSDCDLIITIGDVTPPPAGGRALLRLRGVPLALVLREPAWRSVVAAVVHAEGSVAFRLEESGVPGPGSGPETAQRAAACGRRIARCPVHPSSPHLTAAEMGLAAASLVVERVARLASEGARQTLGEGAKTCGADGGPGARTCGADDGPGARTWGADDGPGARKLVADDGPGASARMRASERPPGLRDVIRWVWRVCVANAREILFREQWFVLVGRERLDADGQPIQLVPCACDLRALIPPADRSWADPHVAVLDEGGSAANVILFAEEYRRAERRGRIVAFHLTGPGLTAAEPATAMAAPHHLSYPFVLQEAGGGDEGGLCLLPEQAAAGELVLYAADRLPDRWSVRAILLGDVRVVDATLLRHEGMWWLFACAKTGGPLDLAYELRAYSAAAPDAARWRPHPQNPLLVDIGSARPAGPFFRHGGCLYRPAQDGSRTYGGGLVLNEVVRLTAERYEERAVARLDPDWEPGLCGTHTLSRSGGVVALDAARRVPRWHR